MNDTLQNQYVTKRDVINTICFDCLHGDLDENRCFNYPCAEIEAVMRMPVTQPEIIRCKECKHYKTHTLFGNSQSWCERWCDGFDNSLSICTEPDDYCSYGEEIEDEQSSIQKRQEN